MGGKGGGGGMDAAAVAALQAQSEAASRQLAVDTAALNNQYAVQAEQRAIEREEEQRKREMERLRASEVNKAKLENEEEAREAQMLAEAGFTDDAEQTGELGSLNLDATTIERPGYENLDERPE